MPSDEQEIIDMLYDVSQGARSGDYNRAALSLNTGIIRLQRFLQRQQSSPGFQRHGGKITYSLETLSLLLEQKDWVAIADVIDYEFVPLFKEAFPGSADVFFKEGI